MNVVRMILLLLVPLVAAAPALVRVSVQAGVPCSAVVRLGARPAHESREIADDVWRTEGGEPTPELAWESLFSDWDSAALAAPSAVLRDPWDVPQGGEPPVESGLGEKLRGRAPPPR